MRVVGLLESANGANEPSAALFNEAFADGKEPQLAIRDGGSVQVPLLRLDSERFQIPLPRRLEIPLLLGDRAQLVIGDGGCVEVSLLLRDGKRFERQLPCPPEIP